MDSKQYIRNHIREFFINNSSLKREKEEGILIEKILSYIQNNDSKNICLYEHMNDEVKTNILIKKLLKTGKSIYIPNIISDTRMQLVEYNTWKVYSGDIDVFFIPGRAFNTNGARLWRGKWFYDRFLIKKQYKHSRKVGICYSFQIVSSIPMDPHDIFMDQIISV